MKKKSNKLKQTGVAVFDESFVLCHNCLSAHSLVPVSLLSTCLCKSVSSINPMSSPVDRSTCLFIHWYLFNSYYLSVNSDLPVQLPVHLSFRSYSVGTNRHEPHSSLSLFFSFSSHLSPHLLVHACTCLSISISSYFSILWSCISIYPQINLFIKRNHDQSIFLKIPVNIFISPNPSNYS